MEMLRQGEGKLALLHTVNSGRLFPRSDLLSMIQPNTFRPPAWLGMISTEAYCRIMDYPQCPQLEEQAHGLDINIMWEQSSKLPKMLCTWVKFLP